MRLGRQCAQRHRRRGEALHDLAGRFDVAHRGAGNGVPRQQVAQQRDGPVGADRLEVGLPVGRIPGARGALGRQRHPRRRDVGLAGPPGVLVVALGDGGCLTFPLPICGGGVEGEPIEADASHPGTGKAKGEIRHLFVEADALEQLASPVGADRADTHLREHLQQAHVEQLPVVRLGLDRGHPDDAVGCGGPHLFDRQVRVHGRRAACDETRQVVGIPSLPRDRDDRGAQPDAGIDQVMVHGADGEQHRDRRMLAIGLPVGEDDDRRSGTNLLRGGGAQVCHRLTEPRAPGARIEEGGQPGRLEVGGVAADHGFDLGVAQHRGGELDEPRLLRRLVEQ